MKSEYIFTVFYNNEEIEVEANHPDEIPGELNPNEPIHYEFISVRRNEMKSERQLYEEYIAAQLSRLEALEKQVEAVQKDIDNVRKLMVECPYEVPHDD